MKRFHAALGVLLLALGVSLTVAAPAQAGTSKYEKWLDETAVIVTQDGVVTTYTERQVGVPAFQAQMKQRFEAGGGVQPQTIWWNCQAGVGCVWDGFNGTGAKWTISFGQQGTNCFHMMPEDEFNNLTSSLSADYGSGYDLKFWDDGNCLIGSTSFVLLSSHAANLTGPLALWNNIASSGKIGQWG